MELPRGIRNKNPGNIEKNDSNQWQGASETQRDKRFITFNAPKWGIRAIARTLITYQDKRRADDGSPIDTVTDIINRWAPSHENNTDSYINAVSHDLGLAVDGILNVHDYDTMLVLVTAIIKHENGMQPYDIDTLNQGLMLAGIEPPLKPLHKSRTIAGSSAAVAVVSVQAVVNEIETVKDVIAPLAQYININMIMLVLTVGCIGLTIWSRIDDMHKKGR